MSYRRCFVAALVLVLTGGCASTPVELKASHPYGMDLQKRSLSWHQLSFKWYWNPQEDPEWPLDLLVADLVVSGLITRHQGSIPLWRFHRRAAPDAAGHQLSFAFYSTKETASEIGEAAAGHDVTRALLQSGRLERVFLTEPGNSSELTATSDSSWPEPLQASWPMFIMGVSQTWLALIETHAVKTTGSHGLAEPEIDEQVRRYTKVSDRMNELWSEYAQHAFFHHLSGVFGYTPMLLRKQLRF